MATMTWHSPNIELQLQVVQSRRNCGITLECASLERGNMLQYVTNVYSLIYRSDGMCTMYAGDQLFKESQLPVAF